MFHNNAKAVYLCKSLMVSTLLLCQKMLPVEILHRLG